MKLKIIGIGFILFAIFSSQLFAVDLMAEADSLFAQRNAIFDTEKILADSGNINKSITFYQKIIDSNPDSATKNEAVWKILRNYYFKGLFVTHNIDERIKIYTKAVEIGEKYITELPKSVAINCWLGILWGYWGEVNSKIASVRKGVPDKVRFYAEKTIMLDSTYLDAGGYRMLGRLNFKVPHIPLIINWPSRKKSLEYLEKAHHVAPNNLFNKLFLAEVLLDLNHKERGLQLLNDIIQTRISTREIAVDTFLKHQAQILLKKYSSPQ